MASKRIVGLMLAVAAAAALTGCARYGTSGGPWGIKGGDPGGPIIVIRPEPEPTAEATVTNQCKTKPCWYAGRPANGHWSKLPNEVKWIKDPKGARTPAYWEGLRCIGITTSVGGTLDCGKQTGTNGFDQYQRLTLELDEGDHTSQLVIKKGFAPNFYYPYHPDNHGELFTVWGRDPAQWPPELKKTIKSVTAFKDENDTVGTPIDLTKEVQIHLY